MCISNTYIHYSRSTEPNENGARGSESEARGLSRACGMAGLPALTTPLIWESSFNYTHKSVNLLVACFVDRTSRPSYSVRAFVQRLAVRVPAEEQATPTMR